ncbi:hypothetical protein NLJ89_g10937 [Agrocybe chaxingu]|uniref:Uncharacterized protein n=1 Tax=Agrocybe chaxingu TaxID=84603 RepID=A0A9W8JQ71_9AGAR|nr:hypothetical protein NLJ89_g10937 [Agrocybe chaxingu]
MGATTRDNFGSTILSSCTLNFQTRVFSALPANLTAAFKNLCRSLLAPPADNEDGQLRQWDSSIHATTWRNFDFLGMMDRYESIIASVGYEHIEQHVLDTCTGEWSKTMLEDLRTWMSDKVVPWMLHVYARGATSADEARTMLQGVGSRFDFHINKTLCELRTREIFTIIIDYPDFEILMSTIFTLSSYLTTRWEVLVHYQV